MNPRTDKAVNRLQQIDPYEFEQLVGQLWELQGYRTSVSQQSGDRGIDIRAHKNGKKVLIQAKRYSQKNKIGSKEIRKYATLYQQEPNVDSVVIVSTSELTDPAEKLSDDLGVEVYNSLDMIELIKNNVSDRNRDDYHVIDSFLSRDSGAPSNQTDGRDFSSNCPNCGSSDVSWNQRTRLVDCNRCTETFKYRDSQIVESSNQKSDLIEVRNDSEIRNSPENSDSATEEDDQASFIKKIIEAFYSS